jgi:hypothetical protein
MSTREIKVGDRLQWIDYKGKVWFTVAKIEGDYLIDSNDYRWLVTPGNRSQYSHVDPPQAEPQADAVNHSARECHRITNTKAFANAELFAAAPELLACLEELVTLKDTKPHDYEERKAKAWRAAREAINKARGGK